MSDTPVPASLSPAGARQIDQTCDRFEASWKAGQRPRPEDYLVAVGEPERSALLRQLLLLDWEYRRRAGEEPRGGDYHARFPDDSAVIDDVGREITEFPVSTRRGSDGAHGLDTPWFGAAEAERMENPLHAESGAARYELGRELGHGGIGVVFRGRDRLLGRELAVKVLRDDYRDHSDARRRFTEEARVGSQLQHPAIVPVYEQGWFDDRRPYFTMKLVEGHTLAALLQCRTNVGQDSNPASARQDRNPAPQPDLPRLLGIFEQVCQAMAYAHARGVVHRDLKPANIMVGAFGEVQVMDWGLAKQLQSADCSLQIEEAAPESSSETSEICNSAAATHSGLLMGTPAHMPPEQARGHAALIDPRADVFALGAILCEILTGRPPYIGDSSEQVCAKAAEGDLEGAYVRLDACGADEQLRELAKRCLAAERSARPPDAGVVAKDLTAYLASAQERLRHAQLERAAAEARAEEAGAKAKAERRARRLTLALAAAAVVVLALAGGGWWWRERVQQAQASQAAAMEAKVETALTEAADRMNRGSWSQARAAAIRARELLQTGASDHWKQRVDELLTDLDMVGRIEEITFVRTLYDRTTRYFPLEKALPLSVEAFARYGIRPGMDPAEVGARVAQRPAPVRDALVSGLENWWLIAWDLDGATHDWLGAVLLASDADEWRTRVRRAVVQRDRRLLEELAAQADAARQPRATVTSLTWGLFAREAYDAAVALLRPAQRRYPDDFWINYLLALALHARQASAEALPFYSAALALRPEGSSTFYVNLGGLLLEQKDWDGAISVSRKALQLQPDSAQAYTNLGAGLLEKGEWEQAEAAFRKAIELDPELAQAHGSLGVYFERRGLADQAVAAYERALRLAPAAADIYYGLGHAHELRSEFDAALAAYDKGIELNPGRAPFHNARGNALREKGRVHDAIAAYERAIRLAPTGDSAHSNLGMAWLSKGRSERALAACSRAVELNPDSAKNHYNLGIALQTTTDFSGAVPAYREAIRLDPNYAEAYCNLSQILREQGRFAEALAAIEQGHRLGLARGPKWLSHYPSDKWLKATQWLIVLDANLPRILDGSDKPATVWEHLGYAGVCRVKGLYAASVRLYVGVFTAEPALAQSPETRHRFLAASAAALAGTGQGRDDPKLDASERVRLRKQALDWLRADLALWADRLQRSPQSHSAVQSALEFWRSDKALAGIREPQEVAKLPESERAGYIRFWSDVQELLVRCMASAPGK